MSNNAEDRYLGIADLTPAYRAALEVVKAARELAGDPCADINYGCNSAIALNKAFGRFDRTTEKQSSE